MTSEILHVRKPHLLWCLFFPVIATTVINPLELIRTKMQSEQLSYSQIGLAVSRTVKQEGMRGVMKGLGPSLYRDVPFSGQYCFIFGHIKWVQ